MDRYPCKNCTKRYLACWDTCDTYQAYSIKIHAQKDLQKEIVAASTYTGNKTRSYKTKYGWRF